VISRNELREPPDVPRKVRNVDADRPSGESEIRID
jgi:hypothetical protein